MDQEDTIERKSHYMHIAQFALEFEENGMSLIGFV
jgi:hypothetical protein